MKKPSKPYICGREKINSMYWKYKSGHLLDKRMSQFLSVHTELDLFHILRLMDKIKNQKTMAVVSESYSYIDTTPGLQEMLHSWWCRLEKLTAEYKEKQDEYERWLAKRLIRKE